MSLTADGSLVRWAAPLLGFSLPLLLAWPLVLWFDHQRNELQSVHAEVEIERARLAQAEQIQRELDQVRWQLLTRSQVLEALEPQRLAPLNLLQDLAQMADAQRLTSLTVAEHQVQATVLVAEGMDDERVGRLWQQAGFAVEHVQPSDSSLPGRPRFEITGRWRGLRSSEHDHEDGP